MTVPIENQKNIKNVIRKGATRLLGVNSLGQAAYRDFNEFLTPDALGTKADKVDAVLEGQPTAPTPNTADKSDRLATTAFTKDAIASITPVERATVEEVAEGEINDKYVTPLTMAPITGAAAILRANLVDFDSLRGGTDTEDAWAFLKLLLETDSSERNALLSGAHLRFRAGRSYRGLTRDGITLPQFLHWEMEGNAFIDFSDNPGIFAPSLLSYSGRFGMPTWPEAGDYLSGTYWIDFPSGTVAARGWKVLDRLHIRATAGLTDMAVGAFQMQGDYDLSAPSSFSLFEPGATYAVGDGVISVDNGKSYRCTVGHTSGPAINLSNFVVTGMNATSEDMYIDAIVGERVYLNAPLRYNYPSAAAPIVMRYEDMGHHTFRNFNFQGNYPQEAVARGYWKTATAYTAGQTVYPSGVSGAVAQEYICLVDHTSGAFMTDVSAGRWQRLGSDRFLRFNMTDKVIIEGGTISRPSGYGIVANAVANFVLRDLVGYGTNRRSSPGGFLALSGSYNQALIDNVTIYDAAQPFMTTSTGSDYGVAYGTTWRHCRARGGNSGFTQHWMEDGALYDGCEFDGGVSGEVSGSAFDIRTPSRLMNCRINNGAGRAVVLRNQFMGFGRNDTSARGTVISGMHAHNCLTGIQVDDQMFNPGPGTMGWPNGRLEINDSEFTRIGGTGTQGALSFIWTRTEAGVAGVYPILGQVAIRDTYISMRSSQVPIRFGGRWTRPSLRNVTVDAAAGYSASNAPLQMFSGGVSDGENRPINPRIKDDSLNVYGGYGVSSIDVVYTDTLRSIASASTIIIDLSQRTFIVTGTTEIRIINRAQSILGDLITLLFTNTVVISHNNAGAGGLNVILLAGETNFTANAGDTLTLRSDGTKFIEVSRSIA